MGLFEENPWLLVPFVLAVVVAYDTVKAVVRVGMARSRRDDCRASR